MQLRYVMWVRLDPNELCPAPLTKVVPVFDRQPLREPLLFGNLQTLLGVPRTRRHTSAFSTRDGLGRILDAHG